MEYALRKVGVETESERREYLLSNLAEHGSFEDVLGHIFKHLDFKRLKICRMVSKRWDEEACRILRKRCIFYIKSRSRKYEGGLAELLKFRDHNLPLPFKVLHVHFIEVVLGEGYKILTDILQKESFEIEKIRVGPIYSSDTTSALLPILQTHAPTLSHLTIDHYQSKQLLHKLNQLSFDLLDSLTFNISTTWKLGLKDLLVMVINGAPKLRHVSIDHSRKFEEGNNDCLTDLMTLPNFQNIHSLTVDVFNNTDAANNVITSLDHFQNLKSLGISSRSLGCVLVDEDKARNLIQSLRKFSAYIEHLDLSNLRLDPDVIEEEFPYCRSLQSLNLFELDLGFQYLERMPALKKISFHRCYFEAELTLESNITYETVNTIQFLNVHDFLSHFEWSLLQKTFPNCKNLLMSPSFGICYCNAVLKNDVPSLVYSTTWTIHHITLDNSVNSATGSRDEMFLLLTGIKKDRWEFAVSNGLDPERIRIHASILELNGLTSLTMIDYEITDPIITLGLSRLQNLRFLQANLSEDLRVTTVEKHLQRLEEINVTNCCGHPFKYNKQVQMEQLFARVPSARCGCKGKSAQSWMKCI